MQKITSAIALCLLVTLQYSCKKDKDQTKFCNLTTMVANTQTRTFTYGPDGYLTRLNYNPTLYTTFARSGNTLNGQSYNAGVPIGSPTVWTIDDAGRLTMVPGSSDTSFYKYNNSGQLIELTRRNDTIISRNVFTYVKGDAISSVEYNKDSVAIATRNYDYYTDYENRTNINILYDVLDNRYGVPSKHYLKQIRQSRNGDISYSDFYYTFDDDGTAKTLQIVSQPTNYISNLSFNYDCK